MTFLNDHAVWAHGPVYVYFLLTLIDTHITTACVTLYLHRAQTHRSIRFHPVIEHLMRLWLFGSWGIGMWLVEMAWIPLFAAGVINGLGHWWGYRNFDTPDQSRNLPGRIWSLLTCGEALHNNHHHVQNAARFSVKRGEID